MRIIEKIKNIKAQFLNLSLITKMFILFALAGVIPLIVSFSVSYKEILGFSLSNQKHMIQQGNEQTMKTVSDQLMRVHSISTLIVGNQTLNESLKNIEMSRYFPEQYVQYKKINNNLSNLYFSTEYNSVTYFVNGNFKADESLFPLFCSNETKEGRYVDSKLKENDNKPVWMLYKDNHTYNTGKYLSLCRYVSDMSDFNKYIGTVMINIDVTKIRDTFILPLSSELTYIRADDGQLIVSNNDKKLADTRITPEIEKRIKNGFSKININGKDYLASNKVIPETNLRLLTMVPINSMSKVLASYYKEIVVVYIFICVIMLIMIYAISKSISRRIVLLSQKIRGVRKGSFKKLLINEQKDEIGDLITNYNFMIDEIKSLLYLQFELGQQKKGAELKALQSQINPHFLYNTLDMINWMAQRNENESIRQTVFSLSKYYRLILNKGDDIITIRDEIELCKAYIDIQQKRFKDKIDFVIDIEEGVMPYLIPKITLQPLIENAILHGIVESKKGRGTVILSGWEEDENIILSVTDDGDGIEDIENIGIKPSGGSGYGLKNIEMRLEMFYGISKCITYDSTKGVGTCVSLKTGKKLKTDDQEE